VIIVKTIVISAFPACGKTCYYKKHDNVLDSDSSNFSWIKDINGNNTNVRNPNFPNNYIQHIKQNIGKVELIFVSSHQVVRDALRDNDIKYVLIYPDISMKDEWIDRFKNRGNDDKFIKFIASNWNNFIKDMNDEVYPYKIRLPYESSNFIDLNIILKAKSLIKN